MVASVPVFRASRAKIFAITLAMGFSHALLEQILELGYYTSLFGAIMVGLLVCVTTQHLWSIKAITKNWQSVIIPLALALLISESILSTLKLSHLMR